MHDATQPLTHDSNIMDADETQDITQLPDVGGNTSVTDDMMNDSTPTVAVPDAETSAYAPENAGDTGSDAEQELL